MLPLIRRSIREDIVVSTALCDDPWMALIDPGQLEVALLNLVLNARDAIPRDGRIVIETGNTELDPGYALDHREVVPGDYVMICVSDDGKGMSYETISRAFEPFFTTKGPGRGTGLGLASSLARIAPAELRWHRERRTSPRTVSWQPWSACGRRSESRAL